MVQLEGQDPPLQGLKRQNQKSTDTKLQDINFLAKQEQCCTSSGINEKIFCNRDKEIWENKIILILKNSSL